MDPNMYKIYFYVPESHLEATKAAVFAKGAGRVGNYDCCAWQTLGTGQFRALSGSHPAIGDINKLERVKECKVETVCADEFLEHVLAALVEAHPYETAAYGFWKITMKEYFTAE
jgi:structural hemagglutinin/hemolysin toxin protein RtxA